jgi:Arginase/agmatinase/formimionoglutamate hydrolase, arginase family
MDKFNPNDVGVANGNFFGLPYSLKESEIILLPIPWDSTVSYGAGTSNGPEAIINASTQVDLFDEVVQNAWETRIGTIPIDQQLISLNKECRKIAVKVIDSLESGEDCDKNLIEKVNKGSQKINDYVYEQSTKYINVGKIVGVVGGEHSVPYGLIQALASKNEDFGILHIDAHADLREAYEGFTFSHASIMYNVIKNIPQVSTITQVAIRDFCNDEYNLIKNNSKLNSYTDRYISESKFKGDTWLDICNKIIADLPKKFI